jgi:hypothetical protein
MCAKAQTLLHSLEKLRGTGAWLDGHDSANSMGATAPLHKTPGTSVPGAEHKALCARVDSWAEVRKCVATHPIAVPYSGYTVQILPGDTYFIDSRGAVVVGFRGSYVRFAAFFVHRLLPFLSDSLLAASDSLLAVSKSLLSSSDSLLAASDWLLAASDWLLAASGWLLSASDWLLFGLICRFGAPFVRIDPLFFLRFAAFFV